MTGKRFESYYDESYWTVRDTSEKRLYCCESDLCTEELVDLLNTLNDENEQLKKDNDELKEAMKRMAIEMMGGV